VKTALCGCILSAVVLWMAGVAAAQIESHYLPPEMPAVLLPPYVVSQPTLALQEVSAPLYKVPAKPPAGADGSPDAITLEQMCKEPREAIRLAESGKFKEALEAGRKLLAKPREVYHDYTWDYLVNATAWSAIQTGDLTAAVFAHSQAAGRIDDPAVEEYHRMMMAILTDTTKSASDLKNVATFRAEVRKGLADRLESLKQVTASAEKGKSGGLLLGKLKNAYDKLRVIMAADPEVAKGEPLAEFRKAAQTMTTSVIPPLVTNAQAQQKLLDHAAKTGYTNNGIMEKDWSRWNHDVAVLWNMVHEIKRLCRISDYMVRMNLSDPGDAAALMKAAHETLFDPDKKNDVWQTTGKIVMINNIKHLDIRLRAPYNETYITPWGTDFSGQLATPHGLQPLQNNMQAMDPMTGQLTPMTGQMTPMNGQLQPMTGKMAPMTGKMGPMNNPMQPMN